MNIANVGTVFASPGAGGGGGNTARIMATIPLVAAIVVIVAIHGSTIDIFYFFFQL